MQGRGWALCGVAVAALAAVLVVRTLGLKAQKPDVSDLPPAPVVDVATAAQHLSQAIRFQTVSHQDPAENVVANWDAQRAWLVATYPAFHAVAKREVLPDGALLYSWQGADPSPKPIILMAHQDVVPVAPETLNLWQAEPFSGAIRDGAVWGRGSIDDKGSLISLMEAGEALAKSGFKPKRTILIVSGQDEEAGGTGARAVAQLLKSRGVQAQYALDEGMAIVQDYPATKKPVAVIGIAEKGLVNLLLTARSAGGHSSAPPKDTAAVSVARAVVAINDHPFALRYSGPQRQTMLAVAPDMPFLPRLIVANDWLFAPLLIRTMAATDQGRAALHTTTAPTMLSGSPKSNVLPPVALARINFRIAPGDTPQSVLEHSRKAVGKSPVEVTIDGEGEAPSPVSSTDSQAYRAIAGLAADISHAPVAPGLVTAATDSRSMVLVADDVYRFQPIRFRLKDIEMVHGANEHLTLENLSDMIGFYQRLMIKTAG